MIINRGWIAATAHLMSRTTLISACPDTTWIPPRYHPDITRISPGPMFQLSVVSGCHGCLVVFSPAVLGAPAVGVVDGPKLHFPTKEDAVVAGPRFLRGGLGLSSTKEWIGPQLVSEVG